jgi:hypothetical protein
LYRRALLGYGFWRSFFVVFCSSGIEEARRHASLFLYSRAFPLLDRLIRRLTLFRRGCCRRSCRLLLGLLRLLPCCALLSQKSSCVGHDDLDGVWSLEIWGRPECIYSLIADVLVEFVSRFSK